MAIFTSRSYKVLQANPSKAIPPHTDNDAAFQQPSTPTKPKAKRISYNWPEIAYIATAQQSNSEIQYAVFRFLTRQGNMVERVFPQSIFDNQTTMGRRLRDYGYNWPPSPEVAKKLFYTLAKANPAEHRIIHPCVEWIDKQALLPGYPIRANGCTHMLIPGNVVRLGYLDEKGSLDEWQEKAAVPASYSTRMVTAACLALASPCLHFYPEYDTAGLHYYCMTKKGKTTCLIFGLSIAGDVTRRNIPTWDATLPAAMERASIFNYILMPNDERDADKDAADKNKAKTLNHNIAYGLAKGADRARLSSFNTKHNIKPFNWHLFYLSTGEDGMSEVAALAGCGKWVRPGVFPLADSEKSTFTSIFPAILRVQRVFCPSDGGGCPPFPPSGRIPGAVMPRPGSGATVGPDYKPPR